MHSRGDKMAQEGILVVGILSFRQSFIDRAALFGVKIRALGWETRRIVIPRGYQFVLNAIRQHDGSRSAAEVVLKSST
jgi:hypothetical protein